MLVKENALLEAGQRILLKKTVADCDASRQGAFERGTLVTFCATLPRRMGIAAVVMRLAPDGDESRDLPFTFAGQHEGDDLYTLTLDTAALCGDAPDGLFFYELLFLRGFDTLFSNSINNFDFTLDTHEGNKFRLLVYAKGYRTPAWFAGGTMYHIFADRFCRGEGEAALHGGRLNPDWENGIPQYAPRAGAPLSNDVFFGGNLWGVAEKLDYLQKMGVTVLYLSPVFEAASNHRYDTADYEHIDSLLGGKPAFDALVKAAHARGMRIILDGVFNHTGDDSRYFNRRGSFPNVGAYQSKRSPYYPWFHFTSFPKKYESWWGIDIMPRLNHQNESCRRYFTGEDGIGAAWLRAGADGWRLDVADELCDRFLDEFHDTVKQTTKGEGLIIGEVWENAVDKISYGSRRRYFRGGQLDSVMNYPFRNAVLALLTEGDAESFYNILTELWSTYPRTVCHALMNLLGTHDTERILTMLGDPTRGEGLENPALAEKHLTKQQKARARALLCIASTLQFTVYGVPSVYYGDEAGMEGYHDPFCRKPYPWGREDTKLQAHYKGLGELRRAHPCLAEGDFRFLEHTAHAFAFERISADGSDRLTVAVNMGTESWEFLPTGAHKPLKLAPREATVLDKHNKPLV